MNTKEMAEAGSRLDLLQAAENDGRGIRCVKSIVAYLHFGQYENALAVRQLEGDKTRAYPLVEAALCDIFGCRLHAKKDCKDYLCIPSKEKK